VTVAAALNHVRLAGRALYVPVAAAPNSPLAVNNGRSQEDLTCGTDVASGVDGPPGRAFKLGTLGSHPS